MEDLVDFAVNYARNLGVSYSEARYQSDIGESIILKNHVPEAALYQEKVGVSVRIICKHSLGFASTSDVTKKGLIRAVDKAFKFAKAGSKIVEKGVSMGTGDLGKEKVVVRPRIKFSYVDLDSKVQLLMEADENAGKAAEKIGVKLPARILTSDTLETMKIIKDMEKIID